VTLTLVTDGFSIEGTAQKQCSSNVERHGVLHERDGDAGTLGTSSEGGASAVLVAVVGREEAVIVAVESEDTWCEPDRVSAGGSGCGAGIGASLAD